MKKFKIEKNFCNFCQSTLTKPKQGMHDKAKLEFERLKEELEATKTLLKLRETELEELKEKNNDLNDKILSGKIVLRNSKDDEVKKAMMNLKKACIKKNIRLSYEHASKRIRHSFKSDFNEKYYRIDFKLKFPPLIALINDAEKIIDSIKNFVDGINVEGFKKTVPCEMTYEYGTYVIHHSILSIDLGLNVSSNS